MGASANVLGQLGISASNPVDAKFDFISEGVIQAVTNIEHDGVNGLRGTQSERIRQARKDVGGPIRMRPNPEELAALLPWILGANASGTTYALAETLPERYVTVDKVAKVMTYAGTKVNRATFSASSGGPLELSLDLIALTETVANAGTFPSLSLTNTGPLMLSDTTGAFSLAGSAELVSAFSLTIDNMLLPTFNNSLTAGTIIPQGRMVQMSVTTPYTADETSLYDTAVGGIAVSITFTFGNYSLVFTLPKWQVPAQTPSISGKAGELQLQLNGIGRRSGSTQELTVTLDSTG